MIGDFAGYGVEVGFGAVEELDFFSDQGEQAELAAQVGGQVWIEAVRSLEGEDVVGRCVAAQVAGE